MSECVSPRCTPVCDLLPAILIRCAHLGDAWVQLWREAWGPMQWVRHPEGTAPGRLFSHYEELLRTRGGQSNG